MIRALAASTPVRILLLAPSLLAESLALQLTAADKDLEVMVSPEQLEAHPKLVVWSIDSVTSISAIHREVIALQERWQPAPLLRAAAEPVDFP